MKEWEKPRSERKWVEKISHSYEEAREFDVHFWDQASPGARFYATVLMVLEGLKMKGMSDAELSQCRLRRDIQNIKRVRD
ncbi:MAG: hypothetical protein HQM15_08725 [Deltaproteobacteria bacterium]|nr:hypothetical protein [Deltaproteobacteria bacterium]